MFPKLRSATVALRNSITILGTGRILSDNLAVALMSQLGYNCVFSRAAGGTGPVLLSIHLTLCFFIGFPIAPAVAFGRDNGACSDFFLTPGTNRDGIAGRSTGRVFCCGLAIIFMAQFGYRLGLFCRTFRAGSGFGTCGFTPGILRSLPVSPRMITVPA